MKKIFFIVAIFATSFLQKSFAQDSTTQTQLSQLLTSYYNIKDALIAANANTTSAGAEQFLKTANDIDYKNDAPALAQSDIGIAVGSGTDVAADTADIILVNSNPQDIANLILFGKATYKKMIQNLVWATGYNVVTIPLAAGVLYKAGIVLGPALGAVFMSLSTIIVAINDQLLKKKIGQNNKATLVKQQGQLHSYN